MGPRALAYAESLIGDPALAMNYLEEAAASVSLAIEEKVASGAPPIRNIHAYLFRTFIRMIDDEKHKLTVLENSLHEYGETRHFIAEESQLEIRMLLNEVMAACDIASRQVVVLRLEGFSSKEIGDQLGISEHAAEVRFSKALDHARKTLRIRRQNP